MSWARLQVLVVAVPYGWGQAQETTEAAARGVAGLVERCVQVKQRELAAHLANIEAQEQLASLHEGLGHPERAAEARAKAERAREFHRLAGVELAEYLAPDQGG